MDDVIVLRNSPNYNHYLKKLVVVNKSPKHNGTAYLLHTNDYAGIRYSKTEQGKHTIMLSGGPRITEDDIIKSTDYKVKEIIRTKISESSKYSMFVFIIEQTSKDVQ